MNRPTVYFIVNINGKNGISKLAYIAASDLIANGYDVTIMYPILPFYTLYIRTFKKPIQWLQTIVRNLKSLIKNWPFAFANEIQNQNLEKKLKIQPFLIKAPSKIWSDNNIVVLNGIGSVIQHKDDKCLRKIYLVNQIEEFYHGANFKKYYNSVRENFEGTLVTHCDFMLQYLPKKRNIKVLNNPISPCLWKCRARINVDLGPTTKILFYVKDLSKINDYAISVLRLINDYHQLTILARLPLTSTQIKKRMGNLDYSITMDANDAALAELYTEHALLFYPNQFEDFGMPPVEGLAFGMVPALFPNIGAASHYAKNLDNSIFLTHDIAKDAGTINTILNDKNKLNMMRKSAIVASKKFAPKGYGLKLIE